MPSAQDIIKAALEEIGHLPIGQDIQPTDLTKGLSTFNRRLGQLNIQKRYVFFERSEAFTIGTSQQSYTLGPSGDFTLSGSQQRPQRLERVKLVLTASTPNTEIDLPVLHVEQYADIPSPAESASEPVRVYYQPTVPNGTLWPVPYPTNTGNKFRIFFRNQLTAVAAANVAVSIDLPEGYYDALVLDLAVALVRPYGRSMTPELRNAWKAAWAAIGSVNTTIPYLDTTACGFFDFDSREFVK